jgi:hypothetical protein
MQQSEHPPSLDLTNTEQGPGPANGSPPPVSDYRQKFRKPKKGRVGTKGTAVKLNEFESFGISLGDGLTFVNAETLWKPFYEMGMSYAAFIRFLQALRVPLIFVGETRLVRLQSFQLAMVAIGRVGEPDFIAPGVDQKEMWRNKKNGITEIDLKKLNGNLKYVVTDLLYSRFLTGRVVNRHVEGMAKKVVAAFVERGLAQAPVALQKQVDELHERWINRTVVGLESAERFGLCVEGVGFGDVRIGVEGSTDESAEGGGGCDREDEGCGRGCVPGGDPDVLEDAERCSEGQRPLAEDRAENQG